MSTSQNTYRVSEESAAPPDAGRPVPDAKLSGGKKGKKAPPPRLVSLDAYRGFIMAVLAASGFGIYQLSRMPEESLTWRIVDRQVCERVSFHFEHPPWASNFVPGSHDATAGNPWQRLGVSFWDLIQPAFMFMVGVAMPFSYAGRKAAGDSRWKLTSHALLRAVVLVLLGVFLHSQNCDRTNWVFPNVLAQIGLGYFFAYLLLGRKLWVQLTALAVILVGYWGAYALYSVPGDYDPASMGASAEKGEVYEGFYHHWSKNAHLGQAFDAWFLNLFPRPTKSPRMAVDESGRALYNEGGYVTLNFIPSIATMLMGILCGQLLLVPETHTMRLMLLTGGAVLCLGLGVAAGATVCPIVKRIWTPSWVLFSGGYVIGMLVLFYLLFDVLPLKKLAFPLVVVGMNSLAAYLMGQLLRPWILKQVINVHFRGPLNWMLGGIARAAGVFDGRDVDPSDYGTAMYEALGPVVDATSAFAVMWLILYWMYRQRFFVKV